MWCQLTLLYCTPHSPPLCLIWDWTILKDIKGQKEDLTLMSTVAFLQLFRVKHAVELKCFSALFSLQRCTLQHPRVILANGVNLLVFQNMSEETLWFKADKMYAEVLPKARCPLNNTVLTRDVFWLVYPLRTAHPKMSQMCILRTMKKL